jgi:hypothetical protein
LLGTQIVGVFEAPSPEGDELLLPFELGLLFSFQRPTLLWFQRFPKGPLAKAAESIYAEPSVNEFFRDSFGSLSARAAAQKGWGTAPHPPPSAPS